MIRMFLMQEEEDHRQIVIQWADIQAEVITMDHMTVALTEDHMIMGTI